MLRVFAGLVLALLLPACEGAGWTGANLHQVDGYWLDTETPCDLHYLGLCEVDVHAAIANVLEADPTAALATGSTALPPRWRDSHGSIQLGATAGFVEPSVVVLDLVGGERRVVGLICQPAVWEFDMIAKNRECQPNDAVIAPFRVGAPTPAP